MILQPPKSTLFPTRRSSDLEIANSSKGLGDPNSRGGGMGGGQQRSEEHTSELQSLTNLVCRLLLEKKKQRFVSHIPHIDTISYDIVVSVDICCGRLRAIEQR